MGFSLLGEVAPNKTLQVREEVKTETTESFKPGRNDRRPKSATNDFFLPGTTELKFQL